MLKLLRIRNIALIDELTVDLSSGMNCLTGETGAGKSIIIDSIGALLGARVSKELIRTGAETAYVFGHFTQLPLFATDMLARCEIPLRDDENVIIEREISAGGRNVCRINGKAVSSMVLRQVGETLIDIHGQHENQSLTRVESHCKLLDAFADDEMAALVGEYARQLHEFKELRKELSALQGEPAKRERAIDLLRYQVREIEGAQLTEGEDAELIARRDIAANSEKIYEHLSKAEIIINGVDGSIDSNGAETMLSQLVNELSAVAPFDAKFQEASDKASEIYYELQELGYTVRSLTEQAVFDPQEAELIGQRLDYIQTLKKKYGATIEEVIEFGRQARTRLDYFADSEENALKITKRLTELSDKLYLLCEQMSGTRRSAAAELEKRIAAELSELEMPDVSFKVNIDFSYENDEDGYPVFGRTGLDNVEFLISPNKGELLKPLARIASGGELSRIMLAIKSILNESDRISTMIFDEIDTGISGVSAKKIADKLKKISLSHQVICVTHHAQIAAAAERNLFVRKIPEGDRTVTRINILNAQDKVREISRLLDGDSENSITNQHAQTLIDRYMLQTANDGEI